MNRLRDFLNACLIAASSRCGLYRAVIEVFMRSFTLWLRLPGLHSQPLITPLIDKVSPSNEDQRRLVSLRLPGCRSDVRNIAKPGKTVSHQHLAEMGARWKGSLPSSRRTGNSKPEKLRVDSMRIAEAMPNVAATKTARRCSAGRAGKSSEIACSESARRDTYSRISSSGISLRVGEHRGPFVIQ